MKYAGRISLAFVFCVCIAAAQQTGYVAHASPRLSPHGAFALYLQVPGVTGGVTAPGFTGWFSLLSYSLGSTKAPGTKKPFGTMQMTMYLDSTSPWYFFTHGPGGHHLIKVMKLAIAQAKPANVYLQFTFNNTLVSSFSLNGGGGSNGRPTETVTFDYETVTMCYGSQATHGGCGNPRPSPSPTPTQTPPPSPSPSPTPSQAPSATPMPSPSPSCTPNPAGGCPSPSPSSSPVGGR